MFFLSDAENQADSNDAVRRTGITNIFEVVSLETNPETPSRRDDAASESVDPSPAKKRVMRRRVDESGQLIVEWVEVEDEKPRTGITAIFPVIKKRPEEPAG